ncbi:MAG: metal ABC transporter ATP-binding protein [Oscillospiraceae bacterium]|nr:metal ABC transporter ATP-binding protein [Oscillospiraceae bacterium]MDD4368908.1 metal ABC transporter ATP-binding protein [Oscillospiraceae bacterium]
MSDAVKLPKVEISQLYFSYTGTGPYVLRDINLCIESGEYISVVGDNGSGKSTLMRLLLGFLKPQKGSLAVRASRLAYVPQKNDFSNASFPITVFEMMNAYRRLLKLKSRDCIQSALAQVGMQDHTRALMGTLSGGQHQKILIARALMGQPDLLILDEPSTGVDIDSQNEIYRFLKKLNREQGLTLISVEHNLDAALANSTQIYHISAGQGHLCSPEQYAAELLHRQRSLS